MDFTHNMFVCWFDFKDSFAMVQLIINQYWLSVMACYWKNDKQLPETITIYIIDIHVLPGLYKLIPGQIEQRLMTGHGMQSRLTISSIAII